MFKPDWKNAPDWAMYAAMDAGGEWYWYEYAPTQRVWAWSATGRYEFVSVAQQDWTSSLTSREQ